MDPRWRRLRLLHRWGLGLWLGWLPVGFTILLLQDRFLRPPAGGIMALTYLAAFGLVGWGVASSTCPNCGQAFGFGRRRRWQAPWAPRCVHCNARIGDPITDHVA